MVQFIGAITLFIATSTNDQNFGGLQVSLGWSSLLEKPVKMFTLKNSTPGLPTQSRTEKKWSQDEEIAKWGAFHAIRKKAAVWFFFRRATRMREGGKSPQKKMFFVYRPACNWSTLKTPCNGSFLFQKKVWKKQLLLSSQPHSSKENYIDVDSHAKSLPRPFLVGPCHLQYFSCPGRHLFCHIFTFLSSSTCQRLHQLQLCLEKSKRMAIVFYRFKCEFQL